MTTDPDVIRMVDLFLRSQFYRKIPVSPSWRVHDTSVLTPPHEMLCGPPDADGFAEWRPVDSPVDEEIAAGFDRFLGIELPPSFKSYLMHKCIISTDLGFAILPELDPRHPLGWLEWSVKESRRTEVQARPWYVPFTEARAQMGVLCFDTRRPDEDGDYPVMLALDRGYRGLGYEYAELHVSFKQYIIFICDYIEWAECVNGPHSGARTLADWLEERGRPVPYEVRYYQPWT